MRPSGRELHDRAHGPASGAHPGARRGLERALAAALVAALVIAGHWPVLGARALSLDDPDFITHNPLVTRPGFASAGRFFGEVLNPSTVKGYYLPISMTSLMLDYALGGRPDDLRAFHRTSLALHALNTALIVVLLTQLFGAVAPAAIAGLLFGLHPLTVEPTAWVGERKTLLAACFAFSCLACYVRRSRGGSRGWMAASVGFFLLALLSKPTVITLPLLLLIVDFWPLRRLGMRAVVEKWPFFLLALVSAVITLVSHGRTAGITAAAPGEILQWPIRAAYLLAFYLTKIAWPAKLSCVYPPPAPFTLANPVVLASLAAVGVLTAGLIVAARRAPGPLAGWLFFVAAIAPTLGLVQYSWVIASDKYVYFPALGIVMVIAFALGAAWNSPRIRGAAPVASLLAPVFIILAAEAGGVRIALWNWKDSVTLFRNMEAIAPDSPVVQSQLGVLLAGESKDEDAIRHLRRAIALEPDYAEAHYNLGTVLARAGSLEEAIRHLRRADQLAPNDPATIYNLGAGLRVTGDLAGAESEFRRALRVQPDYVEARNQLAGVLVLEGRTAEAVVELRDAVALSPEDPELQYRLSMALMIRGGETRAAASHLETALRLAPDSPEALNALAWLRATSPDSAIRDTAAALRLARRAVELTRGERPDVLDTRAAAEAAAGRFGEAVATARRARERARQTGDDSLARGIDERVRLYERRVAYVEPARSGSSAR